MTSLFDFCLTDQEERFWSKLLILALVLTLAIGSYPYSVDAQIVLPPTTLTSSLTANLLVNGLDGPVAIRDGAAYFYRWTSTGAKSCQIDTPTGISGLQYLNGSGGPVSPDHPWYPTSSNTVTLTLSCTNGTNTVVDSVSLSLASSTISLPPTIVPDTTAPTTPTNLSATAVSTSQINLTWSASTDNVGVVGYRVWRNGIQIGTVTGTSYSSAGLLANTPYTYSVSAYDAAGNSSWKSLNTKVYTNANFSVNSLVSTIAQWNVRANPGLSATLLGTQPADSLGTVIGGPVSVDGYSWYQVNYNTGVDGWTGGNGLRTSSGVIVPPVIIVPDTSAPSTPTNLSAVSASASQVNLTWSASTDNVGVAGYKVWRNGIQIGTVTGTSYSSTGLSANTSYSYSVSAYDAAGNNSARSTTITAAPAFPIGSRLEPIARWNVRANPGLSATLLGTQPAGSAGTVIGGPVPADGYIWYEINYDTGVDGWTGGNGLRTSSGVIVPPVIIVPDTTAPTTPTNLSATAVSTSQINLTWSASTDNVGVAAYRIERCSGSSTCTSFVHLAAPTSNFYTDTGLTASTIYRYRIKAVDDPGNASAYSLIVSATTKATQTTPPVTTGTGIWLSQAEIMALPMSGAAWNSLANAAKGSWGVAEVSNQDSKHDVLTLAGALYAVRMQDASMRAKTIDALVSAIGTEGNERWLAISRNVGAYTIAADILGLRSDADPNSAGSRVEAWLRSFMTREIPDNNTGVPRRIGPFHSGSNAAAQEGFIFAALAAYTKDRPALDRAWDAFRTYACDPTAPDRENIDIVKGVEDNWAHSNSNPCAVNPKGTTKVVPSGLPGAGTAHRIDGSIINDMRRGGVYQWQPLYTDYPWTGLAGFVPAAAVLHRAGYPAFQVADRALYRTLEYLLFLREQTGSTLWFDGIRANEVIQLANHYYGSSFPVVLPILQGKTISWTDWTHGRSGVIVTPDTTAPTTPTNLSATAVSTSQINLSWTASTDNTGVTGYKVWRNGVQIATVIGTSYSNTGLSANTAYTYTVSAHDAAGNNSARSLNAIATTHTTPPPVSSGTGIWISQAEIMALPMSGAGWSNVKSAADKACGTPNLANQDDPANVCVMAKALVYARTGETAYRDGVLSAIRSIVNSGTYSGRALALGRELAAYVLSADIIQLSKVDSALDAQFRSKIDQLRKTATDSGPTNLIDCHERRPNNWGTWCGTSRVAVALYLNDRTDFNRAVQVTRGWLGDRTSYAGFVYGELDWQYDSSRPVGINPKGATKNGHNIDGVLPDDQRRCGSFVWPPCATDYIWGALEGIAPTLVMMQRAGYSDAYRWSDSALLRAYQWIHDPNRGNNPPVGNDTWQPYLVNWIYGTSFPQPSSVTPGKNIGWTDWTHVRR